MAIFNKVSADAFETMQTEAGMVLTKFDPKSPTTPQDQDILCATSGGITVSCVPDYSDIGEEVDNAPNGTKEYMYLNRWECTLSFTALGATPKLFKTVLGAADIDTTDPTKVTPRTSLRSTDFANEIWWVGDLYGGGMAAVCLKNALSTGGLNLQTTKNGKGTLSVTLTGHYSLAKQNEVPMEFYATGGADNA